MKRRGQSSEMSAIENGSEMSSGTSSENPELPKIPNFEADGRRFLAQARNP
jgi:hypothetical protein